MPERKSEPPHIVVVEDRADVREVIGDMLAEYSYAVTCVPNSHCLRLDLANLRPDLVLLDGVLADRDGLMLADHMTGRGIPIIMMSGNPPTVEKLQSLSYRLLVKPFRLAQLVEAIGAVLGREHRAEDRLAAASFGKRL
jgi:DNA-binding response OmpR family regulator